MKARRRRGNDESETMQNVASATECTGLMPSLPRDEAQDRSEAALYGIQPAKDAGK